MLVININSLYLDLLVVGTYFRSGKLLYSLTVALAGRGTHFRYAQNSYVIEVQKGELLE